jgi:hypothetical protein
MKVSQFLRFIFSKYRHPPTVSMCSGELATLASQVACLIRKDDRPFGGLQARLQPYDSSTT